MRRVVFAVLTVAAGSGCLCGGCGCRVIPQEDQEAEVASRQAKAAPVIAALEAYKGARGVYPERLDELVAEKFLDAIPDLADNDDFRGEPGRITRARPLAYRRDGDGYRLRVEFTFAYTHPLGLGDPTRRSEYRSADGTWGYAAPGADRPGTPPTKKK